MRKCFALLSVVAGMSLLAAISPRQALAGSMTLGFVMPQTVDPPTPWFVTASNTLSPTGGDLLPANGVELHGRAQGPDSIGSKRFNDIDQLIITIKFNGTINIKTFVPKFSNFVPWGIEKSFNSSNGKWTIILKHQQGSAPLNDALSANFGLLTAYSGNGTDTPLGNNDVSIKANRLGQYREDILVTDSTGPTVTAAPDKNTIWSPNHSFVPVTLTGTLKDVLGGSDTYVSGVDPTSFSYKVTNDQTTDVQPPSQPLPVLQFDPSTGQYTFGPIYLEASRLGANEAGRVYKIELTFSDNFGNSTTVTTTVFVVHDQGG